MLAKHLPVISLVLAIACRPGSPQQTAAADQGAAAAAANPRQLIAQRVLDAPQLQQYFHADDVKGRVPVVVEANEHVDPSWTLDKFGKKVEFVPAAKIRSRPAVRFTVFEVEADSARVELTYEVEGIVMKATLSRDGDDWRVDSADLFER